MAEVVPDVQQEFSPGEWFVRITYTRQGRVHVHQVPVAGASQGGAVGADPNSLNGWSFGVEGNAVNTPVIAFTAVNAYVDALLPAFPPSIQFVDAVLYQQPTAGDAPRPRASSPLTGKAGTGIEQTALVQVLKTTFTYRTSQFGRFKQVFTETAYNAIGRLRQGSLPVGAPGVVNYVLSSAGSWIVGRDGSRPASFIAMSVTEDNALRKRYL